MFTGVSSRICCSGGATLLVVIVSHIPVLHIGPRIGFMFCAFHISPPTAASSNSSSIITFCNRTRIYFLCPTRIVSVRGITFGKQYRSAANVTVVKLMTAATASSILSLT